MKRREMLGLAAALPALTTGCSLRAARSMITQPGIEPIASGPFEPVRAVSLCGGGPLPFTRGARGLEVSLTGQRLPADYAIALKIV